jgi:hypothetical protein
MHVLKSIAHRFESEVSFNNILDAESVKKTYKKSIKNELDAFFYIF